MSLVAFGREVRVALDGEDSAAMIDVESRRRDDLRMLGEELDLQSRIERFRWLIGSHLLTAQADQARPENDRPLHVRLLAVESHKALSEDRPRATPKMPANAEWLLVRELIRHFVVVVILIVVFEGRRFEARVPESLLR